MWMIKNALRGYWRRFWLALAILVVVFFAGGSLASKTSWYDEKASVPAVLTQAYAYEEECGYKNRSACSAWLGRFRLEDGRYMDLQIDGFFYANFVRLGEKDYSSAISVSPRQLGVAKPEWYDFSWMTQMISFFLFVIIFTWFGLNGLFEDREW